MKRLLTLAVALATFAGASYASDPGWYGNALPLSNQGEAGLATPVHLSDVGTARRWLSPTGRQVHSFESVTVADTEAYNHIPHSLLWNDATGAGPAILGFRAARSLLHVERGTVYARAFGPGLVDSATVTLSAAIDSTQDSYWFVSFPIDSLYVRALDGDAQCRIESYWP